jgi:serine/threonine protein kinase
MMRPRSYRETWRATPLVADGTSALQVLEENRNGNGGPTSRRPPVGGFGIGSKIRTPVIRGATNSCRYTVRENIPEARCIIDYIRSHAFRKPEPASTIFTRNKRHQLFTAKVPGVVAEPFLKVNRINSKETLLRRLNVFLRGLLVNDCLNAFHGALIMEEAGLKTLKPLACWTYREHLLYRSSYFLFEPAPCDYTLWNKAPTAGRKMSEEESKEWHRFIGYSADYVRVMHEAGIRHGDPAPGNFLITENAGKEPELALIDTDTVRKVRFRIPFVRSFFDLACTKRLALTTEDRRRFLKCYFGDQYREYWWFIAEFWRLNLWRRIRGKKCPLYGGTYPVRPPFSSPSRI